MKNIKLKLVIFVPLLVATFAVNATGSFSNGYTNVYVFGDSLSDNGNLMALDPSFRERFTNGPVLAEIVADAFGIALTPSNHLLEVSSFGNNYAIAGAKAVDDDGDETTPDINLPTQINSFLRIHGGVAPSDALYIVIIGGDDIRAARKIRTATVLAATREERQAIRQTAIDSLTLAVKSEQAQLRKLIAAGAVKIVVSNAPDVGVIPETDIVAKGLFANAQTRAQKRKARRLPKVSTKLSALYNRMLARELARIERQTGVNFIEYDLFGFLTDQIDNAENFGYTNTDDACILFFSQNGALNPECGKFPGASGFLFWDEIHPTTEAHEIAAREIIDKLLRVRSRRRFKSRHRHPRNCYQSRSRQRATHYYR